MYGFSTIWLAAAITRLIRVGAEAGASRRPFTSFAFTGGGGGGWNVAPPPLIEELVCAIAPGAATSTHASASTAKSDLFTKVEGILFRTPTGLADGLALKELARLPDGRFAPVAVGLATLVPPFRVAADSAWRGSYQMSRRTSPPSLMRYHTSSARARPLLLERAGRGSPRSTRKSAHEIRAISESAMASTVRYAISVRKPGTPCFCSRCSTFLSLRKPRVKLASAGTSLAGIAVSFGMKMG